MTDFNQEKESIEQTLRYFFDGLDDLDAAKILRAFHYKAWSFSNGEKGFANIPVSHWPRTIESAKSDPEHPFRKEKSKKNIVYIDIAGNAAQAKVEWVFSDFKFTDYYNLLKVDDTWQIVNKTYYTEKFPK